MRYPGSSTTISNWLFSSTAILLTAVLIVFTVTTTLYISREISREAGRSVEETNAALAESVDTALIRMETLSMQISYSNLILDRFSQYNKTVDQIRKHQYLNDLMDMFILIAGPSRFYYQLTMYDLAGNMLGMRTTGQFQRQVDLETLPFFEEVCRLDGRKLISAPYINERGVPVISLYRLFFDQYNRPAGIIEVTERASVIFSAFRTVNPSTGIFLTDESGFIIYPLAGEEPAIDSSSSVSHSMELSTMPWSLTVTRPKRELLKPLVLMLIIVVSVGVVIFAFSLAFSYVITRKITNPIIQLTREMETYSLEDRSAADFSTEPANASETETNTGFSELNSIKHSFRLMDERLRSSVEELITTRTQELYSRMLALQAQMNPHFLYNSLAQISITADENGEIEISRMVESISHMLRYTGSSRSSTVTLQDEINHCRQYITMMEHRYEKNLSLAVDIPDTLLALPLPKLILQPLVENAVKACTRNRPPWFILISGTRNGTEIVVTIADNGPGFTPETADMIVRKQREYRDSQLIPGFDIEGMGLLNIYIRLMLFSRNNAAIRIGTSVMGGAEIAVSWTVGDEGYDSLTRNTGQLPAAKGKTLL